MFVGAILIVFCDCVCVIVRTCVCVCVFDLFSSQFDCHPMSLGLHSPELHRHWTFESGSQINFSSSWTEHAQLAFLTETHQLKRNLSMLGQRMLLNLSLFGQIQMIFFKQALNIWKCKQSVLETRVKWTVSLFQMPRLLPAGGHEVGSVLFGS